MNAPDQPTFRELLDWVDGRLDDERAADMATRVVSAGDQTQADLAWIHEFRRAAALMPLSHPPAEVGERARAAFRRLRGLAPESETEFGLDFDSRLAPLVGVRSSGLDERVFRLEASVDELSISLNVVDLADGELDVTGTVAGPGAADVVAVVFRSRARELVTVAPDATGAFSRRVPPEVDDVLVVTGERRLRFALHPRVAGDDV